MDPATAAAFASLRAAVQQAQQVNSQPRAPPPRVERDIVLLEFVPPAPQQKVNKYQKLTPQGLDRQFFVSRSKATRASIGKDIADVYLAPVARPNNNVPKDSPIKPPSQWHRERAEKTWKKHLDVCSEFDRRGKETPDKYERPLVKVARAARDGWGGVGEVHKGSIGQFKKWFKNL